MKYATLKKYMKMYHRNEISRIKLVSAIAKYQAGLVDEKMMDTVGLAVSKSREGNMKYEEVVGTTKVTNIARYFGLSYSAIYRWLKEDLHKSINRGVVFMTESDLSYIGDKVTSSLKKESLGRTVGSADGCSYIRSFVKESEYELKRANI